MKQALIFRKDLKLSAGKMVAQGAHAALAAYSLTKPEERKAWAESGHTKIVLAAADAAALELLEARAMGADLPVFLVHDAGRTEVTPGTATCLAIGPGEIDSITGALPLWKEDG